ncbi:hypothetical protein HAZT_HAZT002170 [Hyalella azteca]|uniref:Spt20-like SEP domain-containing protein n=1 Tax=Hyalella azteca TaxID=294128 RepID=A0A6A0H6V0_HYAAZ|nr:hypothetical protein HAZT_HAZT002170 [Hyalella azteca]
MEGLINKADAVLCQSHNSLISLGSAALAGHAALPRKLAAIYAEEAVKPSKIKQSIVHTSELIGKLVERENLSCLIVNLYRGSEGYSIALKLPGGLETETIRLPYEDDEFLTYIDQELLPPMLLDLLDEADVSDMFQSGCLVAELRDYRRCNAEPVFLSSALGASNGPHCDKRHVLLRPSMQSIAADIAYLTREKDWSNSERAKLEAEIVRATAPPLCLSPDLSASLITRRLHTHNKALHSPLVRRAAKRFSQVCCLVRPRGSVRSVVSYVLEPSQVRQKKFEDGPAPKCLRLYNFLNERKEKRALAKSVPKPLVPIISDQTLGPNSSELFGGAIPSIKDFMDNVIEEVQKHAKPVERPPESGDYSLQFIEEYTLETEKSQGRIYHTKLTIYQRRIDEVFCGELYVDRDYQEGKLNGSTCTFKHYSIQSVHRYIAQFREIFSEEGRKSVKIKHVKSVGGAAPAPPYNQQQNVLIVTNGERGLQQQAQKLPAGAVVISKAQAQALSGVAVTVQAQRLHHPVTGNSGLSVSQQGQQLQQQSQQQPQQQQQQPVLLSRNVHLSSLLSGRAVVTAAQAVGAGRSALPVSGCAGVSSAMTVKCGDVKSESVFTTAGPGAVPALQALLAGTPSAENPAPNSRNAELIKRLAQQTAQPNKGDIKTGVKVDITASALPTITTINCTPTTGSLVCSSGSNSALSSLLSGSSSSAGQQQSSLTAAVLRSDSGNAPPPNINIANIANLPGLNVGLQNLTSGLGGVQNVQVSIPGLPVPISLSLSAGPPTSSASLPHQSPQQQSSVVGSSQSSHPVIIASSQPHPVT